MPGALRPGLAASSSRFIGTSSPSLKTFFSTGMACAPPLTSHEPPGTAKSATVPPTFSTFEPRPTTLTAAPAWPAPGMNIVPTFSADSVRVAMPSSFHLWKGSSAFRSMPTRLVATVAVTWLRSSIHFDTALSP